MSTFKEIYNTTDVSATLKNVEEWIKLGCGDEEYICQEKNALFPAIDTPDQIPDLSRHTNYLGDVLKKNPGLYDQLKNKTTKNGVSLAKCIKTGVDNPGHPNIKTVGMVAGDEESYDTFKALFDPVISARHGGYQSTSIQPTNLNISDILDIDIDPYNKYVLTSRIRTARNARGIKLPPSCSFEERRKMEANSVEALLTMKEELKGDYFPLNGSKSYAPKPNGMSLEKQEHLLKAGNLFQEPDSTLLLCSGMARHWPDARGIFHNNDETLFVWINEEDHMRIVSMQKGKDIKAVAKRFIMACDQVQKVLKRNGLDFMHNNHLGWITTCPSNLGTGLRGGCWVKIPQLSDANKPWDFKKLVYAMRLQSRGTGGVDATSSNGIFDISNKDRLGKSEVELVNIMITGIRQFVDWEYALDNGNVDQVKNEIESKYPSVMKTPVYRYVNNTNSGDWYDDMLQLQKK